MSEGNIISFKVFINSKGVLMTEYSRVPDKDLNKIFSSHDMAYILRVLAKTDPKFKNLHDDIQEELEVLN